MIDLKLSFLVIESRLKCSIYSTQFSPKVLNYYLLKLVKNYRQQKLIKINNCKIIFYRKLYFKEEKITTN